mmetsp:Transcript_17844/g.47181  ORF Transcript_17844/g.47181 Transcript_17844/m.47181 type:complete len:388 (+) Transcript_17844:634-1797(+)
MARLSLRLVHNTQGNLAQLLRVIVHGLHILTRDVGELGLRGVVLAVRREALGDADARAVELAHDPLLLLRRSALFGRQDEIRGPPQRDRLVGEPEGWHHLREVLLQEILRQGRELRLLGPVERVDRAGPPHGGDAALLRLLVDDAQQSVADHVVPELPFDDARAEALVHQLAALGLPSLEVLALALGGPGARRRGLAVRAEFDELRDGVLLFVVVVGLHQVQLLAVVAALLPESAAVLAGLELDDPNALSSRATVLLDDARLEGHCFLEACSELCGIIVGQGVLQADAHVRDLAQGVLGAHELHHVRRWPNLHAILAQSAHGIVEFALVATVRLDLARIATDDQRIEGLAHLEELGVVIVDVTDQLAAHAGQDHSVGEGDRVVTVPI